MDFVRPVQSSLSISQWLRALRPCALDVFEKNWGGLSGGSTCKRRKGARGRPQDQIKPNKLTATATRIGARSTPTLAFHWSRRWRRQIYDIEKSSLMSWCWGDIANYGFEYPAHLNVNGMRMDYELNFFLEMDPYNSVSGDLIPWKNPPFADFCYPQRITYWLVVVDFLFISVTTYCMVCEESSSIVPSGAEGAQEKYHNFPFGLPQLHRSLCIWTWW